MRNAIQKIIAAIGYNPTANQSEYGNPKTSGYGAEVSATPPQARLDYFPTFPYRSGFNYLGSQVYFDPMTETLYADTFGYRGITPLSLQPVYDIPEPWTMEGQE